MNASNEGGPGPRVVAPPIGSVHGFRFRFGEQNLKYPHPGIIASSKIGIKDGRQVCGVIALAISHADQNVSWHSNDAIPIPFNELAPMGLDNEAQWVCLFEQTVVYFPDNVKEIQSLGKAHLGQASDDFTLKVVTEWSDYRKTRR